LATLIGGTLAAFNIQTDEKATSKISTKDLGIGIYEIQDGEKYIVVSEGKNIFINGNVPGATISKNMMTKLM